MGYSAVISSAGMPEARRFKITLTGTRVPAITAWPCITWVATAAVQELCRLAAAKYGLRTLRAATARQNVAAQRVLAKAGFVVAGPADPARLGGKPGTWYQRALSAD